MLLFNGKTSLLKPFVDLIGDENGSVMAAGATERNC